VAVVVGFLLLLMLLFFLTIYYVKPIYGMLDSLKIYRSFNTPYNYDFQGDDQLHELNENVSELAAENSRLRKRISAMRSGKSPDTPKE
jgi:cell division protein FtsB